MPSDQPLEGALRFTAEARERFLSSVRLTADQVGAHIRSHGAPASAAVDRVAVELGAFAAGRVDAGRIAALASDEVALSDVAIGRLRAAGDVLAEIGGLEPRDFVIRVRDGQDLATEVITAMSHLGRAFVAAELANRVRLGGSPGADASSDEAIEDRHPRDWRSGAHEVAPPLVVVDSGGRIDLAPLRSVLEGNACIVMICGAGCPPAVLVPLLSPRVRLLQTTDIGDLDDLPTCEGPTVVAIVPEGAGVWLHSPVDDHGSGARIAVRHLPEEGDVRPVPGVSEWRQREDLRHLAALAAAPGVAGGAAASSNGRQPGDPVEPVDMLAAWLIKQADVPSAD